MRCLQGRQSALSDRPVCALGAADGATGTVAEWRREEAAYRRVRREALLRPLQYASLMDEIIKDLVVGELSDG